MTLALLALLTINTATAEPPVTEIDFETVEITAEVAKPSLTLVQARTPVEFEPGSLIKAMIIDPQFRDYNPEPGEELPPIEELGLFK